ncbi:MAG: ribbon-helix-helix domain-containing protein [Rickettsiales bacterium]|jgi:predicted DNA-binding ribbon-helix-helix protein|nr:ribbon-helix-helix domain-containing protein [Rickettsiales bacterium]
MRKISVSLSGHNTSISLEDEFADALKKIAAADKTSIAAIINSIDTARHADTNLSSETRIWILRRLTTKKI